MPSRTVQWPLPTSTHTVVHGIEARGRGVKPIGHSPQTLPRRRKRDNSGTAQRSHCSGVARIPPTCPWPTLPQSLCTRLRLRTGSQTLDSLPGEDGPWDHEMSSVLVELIRHRSLLTTGGGIENPYRKAHGGRNLPNLLQVRSLTIKIDGERFSRSLFHVFHQVKQLT